MKKPKKNHSEIEFWQSNTDLMTGLILVLMLIIMLLILYLMQIPEDRGTDTELGDSYNVDNRAGDAVDDANHYPEEDQAEEDQDTQEEQEEGEDAAGGDGGDGDIQTDTENLYEYPFPSHSGEDWRKSSVFATVVDEETGRAIREAGIAFELYEEQQRGDGGALRFLNTYYPVKTEYRNYETTEQGVFYLPEKIEEGDYYFKQITELEGYDPVQAVQFTVDDIYDWPDPYVVSIEISPSKNSIPITLEDMDTHEPIQGGTFQVTAAEDIITSDGSVRFAKNELADTVEFDQDGSGQSKELYLGQYTVTQGMIPKYYASIKQSVPVQVEKKGTSAVEPLKFSCEKTRISLKLTDELYTNLRLEGAEFVLTCDGHPELEQRAATDENGEIVFTDLEKNRVYKLRQITAPERYQFDSEAAEIFVAEDGRIEDEVKASFNLTNYIVRVNIDTKDQLFGRPVSNRSLTLYNSSGEKIRTWTSAGSAETFENLPKGSYYVLADKDKKYEFDLDGEKALQEITVTILTMQNILVIAAGCAILLFGIFAVAMLVRKKKPSHNEESRKDKKS